MAKVTVKRNDLENLIKESITKYLKQINEISTDLKGAAAMRAAKNAKDENLPQWKREKYFRQAGRLSRAATQSGEKELGLTNGYFNPSTLDMGGRFSAGEMSSNMKTNGVNDYNYNPDGIEGGKINPNQFYSHINDKALRRYGKAEDGLNNYAKKAQKYKTDMNSELEENKSKKKELNANHIRAMVAETLKQVLSQRLNEGLDNDFNPCGYYANSNWGGKEIEIAPSGDAARIRTNYGNGPSEPSEWAEIQYDYEDEDGNELEEGRPYILIDGKKEYLDNYMRY